MTKMASDGVARRGAALLVASRIANLATGVVTLPVMIRYLGGEAFAAWALLLALAAAFSLLDLGLGTALVRFLAAPAQGRRPQDARVVVAQAWLLMLASYGAGSLALAAGAAPLARWLGLSGSMLPGVTAVAAVFGAAASRAFLQTGTFVLVASRRFGAVSLLALLQPLSSNVAAMAAAWYWHRLEPVLVAFWTAQLLVVGAGMVMAGRASVPHWSRAALRLREMRELLGYGLAAQTESAAQFVNFHFDKFLIAGFVGLWAVAPYEVAVRAVAALRSVPASGAESFLPTAMLHAADRRHAWSWYVASTRLAAWGAVFFLLVPLSVASPFLYAWTGEMGFLGRGAFVPLCLAAVVGVVAMPAATLAQSQGRPELQIRAAALSVLVNVPLSMWLVPRWGLLGAAVSSAVALATGACVLVGAVHRDQRQPLLPTVSLLARFWAVIGICTAWAVADHLLFTEWFAQLATEVRFSRGTRWAPAVMAALSALGCLLTVVAVAWIREGKRWRRPSTGGRRLHAPVEGSHAP